MKFFGLLAMAAAAVALPVFDNIGAGGTKKLPVFSRFGQQKTHHKTKQGGNLVPELTEIHSLHIPKRDAAPLSELTVGVQGGAVVKRDAKSVPIESPLGNKGIQAEGVVGTLGKILKRWIGMDKGEATNGIEKRQMKTVQGLPLGTGALRKAKSPFPPGRMQLSQLSSLKNDDEDNETGGADVAGVPLPLRAKKE